MLGGLRGSSMQLGIFLGMTLLMGACAASQKTPTESDPVQLAPCPDKPNCVSSLSIDARHRVEPLRHNLSNNEAFARLYGLTGAMPRTKVIRFTPCYLHVEVRSAVFGFIDDVEFVSSESPGIIHMRSASRLGYWDFGVNRRRVERIREEFAKDDG